MPALPAEPPPAPAAASTAPTAQPAVPPVREAAPPPAPIAVPSPRHRRRLAAETDDLPRDLAAEADHYAIIHPRRAGPIRRSGGLPPNWSSPRATEGHRSRACGRCGGFHPANGWRGEADGASCAPTPVALRGPRTISVVKALRCREPPPAIGGFPSRSGTHARHVSPRAPKSRVQQFETPPDPRQRPTCDPQPPRDAGQIVRRRAAPPERDLLHRRIHHCGQCGNNALCLPGDVGSPGTELEFAL